VPPDVLLIALCLGARRKALLYASVCVLGSLLGGCASYAMGRYLFDPVASHAIGFFGWTGTYEALKGNIQANGMLYVFTAALTPVPYCVFTTAAGASRVPVWVLVLAAGVGRGLRFGTEAFLLWRFGPPIRRFIERYLNLLAIVVVALVFAVVLAVRLAARGDAGPSPQGPAAPGVVPRAGAPPGGEGP